MKCPDKDVNELVEDYAKDWVNSLDRDDLRSLSILLHYLLVCLLQLGATDASRWIADVIGKCERTIRDWRASFIASKGSFPNTMQGRYQRTGVLWHNKELNELATRYVRENRVVKGKPNLNLQSFTVWVNTVLLPNHALDPGFPRKISCETARKWLHDPRVKHFTLFDGIAHVCARVPSIYTDTYYCAQTHGYTYAFVREKQVQEQEVS